MNQVSVGEVVGWITISLCPPAEQKEADRDAAAELAAPPPFARAYLVQLAVLQNHQNGRDTHIRQIRVYGPQQ